MAKWKNDTVVRAAAIPAAVIGLSNFPLLTFTVLAICGWCSLATGSLASARDRVRTRLFALAAFFGTIGEAICVYGTWWTPDGRGLWIYAFPSPWGLELKLPIWLPLVWGNLFVLYADLADAAALFLESRARGLEAGRYLFVLIILIYAGLLYRTVDARILFVFTPFFAAFLLYWTTPRDLVLFAAAATLGSFGEIWAMRSGLWIYTKPLFRNETLAAWGIPGVPVSLPMAWGLSAVFLARWAGLRVALEE